MAVTAGYAIRQIMQSAEGLQGKIGPTLVKNMEKGTYKSQYEGKGINSLNFFPLQMLQSA